MIFAINTTRDISKLSQNFTRLMAREITYNKFEISLMVLMPNITTNHAITYFTLTRMLGQAYNLILTPRHGEKCLCLCLIFDLLFIIKIMREKSFPVAEFYKIFKLPGKHCIIVSFRSEFTANLQPLEVT